MPANYVKEVEPKIVRKVVKKPAVIQEQVPVQKTGYRKEKVVRKKKREKDSGGGGGRTLRRTPSGEQ